MTEADLINSASYISARNLTPNVQAVSVSFARGHLTLVYHLRDATTEDDVDEMELTAAELIAEFPEIRTASTACESVGDHLGGFEQGHVVFSRQT